MSLALLFPGQGTQYPTMLTWLDAAGAPLVASLFGDGWRARLVDDEWTTSNRVAQPLLTAASLDAWSAVRDALPTPAIVAGYSVGELAAYAAAGVIDRQAAVELAQLRATAMDRCVAPHTTGLLSVAGVRRDRVEAWCEAHGAWVAIRIALDQHLIGATSAGVTAAERTFTAEGATCRRIAIALASHTPWLVPAVGPLRRAVAVRPFARPVCPIACDATGTGERDPDVLREALAVQVSQTVRWDECLETVRERGVRCVLEVGPGSSLARMWNARVPDVAARSLDEFQDPQRAVDWVLRTLA